MKSAAILTSTAGLRYLLNWLNRRRCIWAHMHCSYALKC